ncbi:SHOCT domain-containing protein [Streptomyces zhihengii]
MGARRQSFPRHVRGSRRGDGFGRVRALLTGSGDAGRGAPWPRSHGRPAAAGGRPALCAEPWRAHRGTVPPGRKWGEGHDALVRRRHERLGLVHHGGRDRPLLGPPHHRRRPGLPRTGPHRRTRRTHRTLRPCRRVRPATPERILGERLARGDIDEDEYRRRLSVLRSAEP